MGMALDQSSRFRPDERQQHDTAVAAPEIDIRIAAFTIANDRLYVMLDSAQDQQLPRSVLIDSRPSDLQSRDASANLPNSTCSL